MGTRWGYAAPAGVRPCERTVMESATITTRTLEIDGMSGDARVQRIRGAPRGVHGVSAQSVKMGAATIGANGTGCGAKGAEPPTGKAPAKPAGTTRTESASQPARRL